MPTQWRVDNEAKAILDDCALRLQREAGPRGVIVGDADPSEKNAANMAMQRAVNTKEYLVKEKGIVPPASRYALAAAEPKRRTSGLCRRASPSTPKVLRPPTGAWGWPMPRTAPRRKAVKK